MNTRRFSRSSTRHTARGVTLVELVVTLLIITILAAIAYPSYTEYIRRGQRAEAATVLLEAAQFMQRFYSANDRYDTATLPAGLSRAPANGTARYVIDIAGSTTRSSYLLEATPQGPLANDKCGTLTLSSTGVRGASGTAPLEHCWR